MSMFRHGAQRASGHSLRTFVVALFAATLALSGLVATPEPVAGAGRKVVIIVGPAGSSTANYIDNARKLAAQARGYGATVYEIYTPNATWSKVKATAQGANVLIYLGHGNGWPSPYGSFQKYTKDGFGLNATAGNGHNNTRYWGEYYISREIDLAPNAVVILNRLCYASGNSEPSHALPTRSVAIQRADNYANGFFRAGAKAVFAEGVSSASFVLYGLFKTNRTMTQIFWSSASKSGAYDFSFNSVRYPGARALMDPKSPGRYYRSLVGALGMTASMFRGG